MAEPVSTISPGAGFVVTVRPPEPFMWNHLAGQVRFELRKMSLAEESILRVVKLYGHLLRMTSWQYQIDWEPLVDRIQVPIPNNIVNRAAEDEKNNRMLDGMSVLLRDIVAQWSVDDLMKHHSIENG